MMCIVAVVSVFPLKMLVVGVWSTNSAEEHLKTAETQPTSYRYSPHKSCDLKSWAVIHYVTVEWGVLQRCVSSSWLDGRCGQLHTTCECSHTAPTNHQKPASSSEKTYWLIECSVHVCYRWMGLGIGVASEEMISWLLIIMRPPSLVRSLLIR